MAEILMYIKMVSSILADFAMVAFVIWIVIAAFKCTR